MSSYVVGGRKGRFSSRLALAGASLLAIAAAAPAVAQTAPAGGTELGEVVVTASRIERLGFTAPTPTTTVGATDLQQRATVAVADLLNELPAFSSPTTPATTTVSSQNAGGNFLNLRSLGANRTLVLVDGRRHVPTTSTGLVDTNVIPSLLIDRIEVVTGGASAAWGSDAVAGVVNLIFKKDFEGLQGQIQAGETQYSDFANYSGGLLWGHNFMDGRAHLMVAAEGSNDFGAKPGSDRGWINREAQHIGNPAYTATNGQPQTLIAENVHVDVATLGGLITSGPLKGTQFLPGGVTAPFTYGSNVGATYMIGGDGINFGRAFNNLATPLQRGSVFTRGAFDITPHLEGFVEASIAYSKSRYALDPSYDQGSISIKADNAYLPANIAAQMRTLGLASFSLGRVNPDLGFQTIDDANASRRFTVGFDGDLGRWKWNAYYENGETRYSARVFDNRINANWTAAIDAVRAPSGDIVCRSTLTNPTNGCVPVNLFGSGSITPAAADYINGTQSLLSHIKEQVAAANITGDLFNIWAGPVSLATGVEWRKESVDQIVDPGSQASIYNIGNPKPMSGSYNVKEVYAETVVPLVKDLPFIKSLDLNGAVRVTDYSTSGTVETWKAGATWDLTDELKIRATRSRDIRAPNLSELYSSFVLTFATVIDPKTNVQTQVQSPTQGNLDLQPEKADTTTWGVVYQPNWAPRLRGSVDVYDIDIKGAISTLAAQDIVNRCFAGNTALCSYITYDASGALSRNAIVTRKNINLSQKKTNGVDIEVSYAQPVERYDANLTFRFLATYVGDLITDDGVTRVNHGGDAGADSGGIPHWRWNGSVTMDRGPLSVFLQGRYIGGGPYDNSAPLLVSPNHVDSQFVVNTSVRYRLIDENRRNLEIYAVVNNIFNQDPPLSPSTFIISSATDKGTYDFMGRRFQVGVRFRY